MSLLDEIRSPKANVFRRMYIKRRNEVTALYESSWVEITRDVKSWGKVSTKLDDVRPYKFTFGNVKTVVNNETGRYNDFDSEPSIWHGHLNQQRTLVRIEAGFIDIASNGAGLTFNNEFPNETLWDEDFWDVESSLWDGASSAVFTGIISGDILASEKNEIAFNIKPLTSVFEDFAAKNLTGFTSTGMTASQFVAMLRDQVDSSGLYVFRPFFGDSAGAWDISTTSNVYTVLNTSTSAEIDDKTVWAVLEKLSEAEGFVAFPTTDGGFKFISRAATTTEDIFEFYGAGRFSPVYGHTIKSIDSFGKKLSKYYSRVRIKYRDADTSTSYAINEADFSVSPSSSPWVLGDKTLDISNNFFATSTTAETAALNIFNEVSSLKREIQFQTSFVQGISIFSTFAIYYDPNPVNTRSLWDQNDWADDATSTSTDLIWDRSGADQIVLSGEEYKFLSFEIDLDNMENKFLAREQ